MVKISTRLGILEVYEVKMRARLHDRDQYYNRTLIYRFHKSTGILLELFSLVSLDCSPGKTCYEDLALTFLLETNIPLGAETTALVLTPSQTTSSPTPTTTTSPPQSSPITIEQTLIPIVAVIVIAVSPVVVYKLIKR